MQPMPDHGLGLRLVSLSRPRIVPCYRAIIGGAQMCHPWNWASLPAISSSRLPKAASPPGPRAPMREPARASARTRRMAACRRAAPTGQLGKAILLNVGFTDQRDTAIIWGHGMKRIAWTLCRRHFQFCRDQSLFCHSYGSRNMSDYRARQLKQTVDPG